MTSDSGEAAGAGAASVREADAPVGLGPAIGAVVAGRDLSREEAARAFARIVSGAASPVRMGAFLAALQAKGPSPSEVAGGVDALRDAMIRVPAPDPAGLVDTCGAGGGRTPTFNISTAAALVAAAGGVRVAKHGNRSFTSKSGSADVLEALGVRLDLSPAGMAQVLSQVGIVFMFAPLLHPAMRHAAPVRKALGITTIMNLLGPLANPAGARRQVVGVPDPAFVDLVVEALAALGHKRALVVHGDPGMDEISPCGPTQVAELADGTVTKYQATPEAMGLTPVPPEALAGGDPDDNAAMAKAVLEGKDRGPRRSAVLANAAGAFYVAGKVESLGEGVLAGARAIDAGAASAVLEKLTEATRAAA